MGSAHDSQYDQILDEILVGPIPVGLNKFVLQADAPNITQLLQQPNITSDDILGVTVVLVTCSYKEREFVRIGYYVNNEYNTGNEEDGVDTTTTTTTTTPTAASAATPAAQEFTNSHQILSSPSLDNHKDDDDENADMTSPTPPPPSRPKISIYDIVFDQVQRQILADKPRVTKFPIPWNDTMMVTTSAAAPSSTQLLPLSNKLPSSSTPSTIASEDDRMMDTE